MSFSGSTPRLRSMVIFMPVKSVSSRTSATSFSLLPFASSIIFSTITSTLVEGGIWVTSMQLALLSYPHLLRTRKLPRPVPYILSIWALSKISWPPPGKSGARRVSNRSVSGSRIRAMVVRQTSAKLKEQILQAMPTAMPVLGFVSMVGKLAGSSRGSFMVLS